MNIFFIAPPCHECGRPGLYWEDHAVTGNASKPSGSNRKATASGSIVSGNQIFVTRKSTEEKNRTRNDSNIQKTGMKTVWIKEVMKDHQPIWQDILNLWNQSWDLIFRNLYFHPNRGCMRKKSPLLPKPCKWSLPLGCWQWRGSREK